MDKRTDNNKNNKNKHCNSNRGLCPLCRPGPTDELQVKQGAQAKQLALPARHVHAKRAHTNTHRRLECTPPEGANAKGRHRRRRRFANELISHFEFKCRLQIGLLQSAAIKQSMGANCK